MRQGRDSSHPHRQGQAQPAVLAVAVKTAAVQAVAVSTAVVQAEVFAVAVNIAAVRAEAVNTAADPVFDLLFQSLPIRAT